MAWRHRHRDAAAVVHVVRSVYAAAHDATRGDDVRTAEAFIVTFLKVMTLGLVVIGALDIAAGHPVVGASCLALVVVNVVCVRRWSS